MKRLIVNADDFGMAESVNDGIIAAHRGGIVTSASFLACGEAAEHAARIAAENPSLDVGVHLCLTILPSALPPEKLPTLTRSEKFHASPFALMSRLAFGWVDKTEIESELRAQIEKALSLGVRPSHLDGHQHVHVMPGIFEVVARLAKEYGIGSVRYPVGPWAGRMSYGSTLEKLFLEGLAKSQRRVIKSYGLKCPDHFFGLAQTGRLGRRELLSIIKGLPEGTSEIMCHPGLKNKPLEKELRWGKGWERELSAVTDARVEELIEKRGIELVNFKAGVY